MNIDDISMVEMTDIIRACQRLHDAASKGYYYERIPRERRLREFKEAVLGCDAALRPLVEQIRAQERP